ncbi:hypothetical protein K470DRAFT_205730, partial [Piedraia hortae CBS 480.64]
FKKYDVHPFVPSYEAETYESHLTDPLWSAEETAYLMQTYAECYGKWPVIHDRYDWQGSQRTLEDLKARFYNISAKLLALETPEQEMTPSQHALWKTLNSFDPERERKRKELLQSHLHRSPDEVEEETSLLRDLQRIMANQAQLESEREDLRRRLDYPIAKSGSTPSSSQELMALWQSLVNADRARKNPRLRTAGGGGRDHGAPHSATSATPREAPPSLDLSKADQERFGVVYADKLPAGVHFASDKLTKPRTAKSMLQTDKITAILSSVGVPELIPLPSPEVIRVFEGIMNKVNVLADMRRIKEKEEFELKVRKA